MKHRDLFSILFGLHVIWTGLWRGIEAAAYKPDALWFCLVMGLISISSAFFDRLGRRKVAFGTALFSAAVVFIFYFKEFVTLPETEATFRIGMIILSSIAQLVVIFLPARK